jgi:plasmid stabilization system protein ParE
MIYDVVVEPQAWLDIDDACRWLARQSPRAAARWFNGLLVVRNSLAQFPARCPIARDFSTPTLEVRQLLYGRGRNVYRILFVIEEQEVRILHVRHGSRAPGRR